MMNGFFHISNEVTTSLLFFQIDPLVEDNVWAKAIYGVE